MGRCPVSWWLAELHAFRKAVSSPVNLKRGLKRGRAEDWSTRHRPQANHTAQVGLPKAEAEIRVAEINSASAGKGNDNQSGTILSLLLLVFDNLASACLLSESKLCAQTIRSTQK